MNHKKKDFINGAWDEARSIKRQERENRYMEWAAKMDSPDYYLLGNILMYQLVHGGLFERLQHIEESKHLSRYRDNEQSEVTKYAKDNY